jgi:DNA-directed RNA polymerase specialized sigma subunit
MLPRSEVAMEIRISREEGHAHVAAVRVLQYRLRRPPTPEEVAEVLGSQRELTLHRLRALQTLGIVVLVDNPFEVHVSVGNHVALDDLPEDVSESGLAQAVEEFKKKQRSKADEMVRLFEETDEEAERRQANEGRADELRKFQPKKPAKKAPWEK